MINDYLRALQCAPSHVGAFHAALHSHGTRTGRGPDCGQTPSPTSAGVSLSLVAPRALPWLGALRAAVCAAAAALAPARPPLSPPPARAVEAVVPKPGRASPRGRLHDALAVVVERRRRLVEGQIGQLLDDGASEPWPHALTRLRGREQQMQGSHCSSGRGRRARQAHKKM